VNYKSFFLLPCPQSQNNTSTKLDPNQWSYLIFGEYSVLWLEKKKIGESFKVRFGEKSPNNGKYQHHHTNYFNLEILISLT
jgi:hypothetical protein